MHSLWFRKPASKKFSVIAIISICICGVLFLLYPYLWYIFVFALIFWFSIFLIASLNIRSGMYVPIICEGNSETRKIAITFDDGPSENTNLLLDILAEHKVKATFFLVGNKLENQRLIVEKMKRAGHTIANHSTSHALHFPIMSSDKIRKDITETQTLLQKICLIEPIYFRPPFGVTNPLIAKALADLDLAVIGWSVRSLDTIYKDPEKIFNRITKRVKPGSIILLHDTSENSVTVLEKLLQYCAQENLAAVNMDELLNSKK